MYREIFLELLIRVIRVDITHEESRNSRLNLSPKSLADVPDHAGDRRTMYITPMLDI